MRKWTTIGEVFRITSGGTPQTSISQYYDNGKIFWVNSGDLKVKNLTSENIPKRITEIGLENSSAKILPVNTVLIALYGATIGNCSILKTEAATNQACAAILPSEELSPEFLYYYLLNIKEQLLDKAQGGGQQNISIEILKRTPFPILNYRKQLQIVTVLEKFQEVTEKRKKSIFIIDQILKNTFLEIFGEPAKNPKKFLVGPIKGLIESANYGTSEKSTETGAYPYIRMNNVTYEGYFDFTDLKRIDATANDLIKYGLKKGDIVFNRTNSRELVGKTSVYQKEDEVIIAGYLIRIRTKLPEDAYYISGYLNSSYGKAILKNMSKNIVGMANINAQEFQSIKILLPPPELRKKYSECVVKILDLREKLLDNQRKGQTLFDSLLKGAFDGKLKIKQDDIIIQEAAKSINWLKEQTDEISKVKGIDKLYNSATKFVVAIPKLVTAANVASALSKMQIPTLSAIRGLQEIMKVHQINHLADISSTTAAKLLLETPFFKTNAITEAAGKAVLQLAEEKELIAEAEELEKQHADPILKYLGETKIGNLTLNNYDINIIALVKQYYSDKVFTIEQVMNTLSEEKAVQASYETLEKGVFEAIDSFIVSEFWNTPFTFQQLQEFLQRFQFKPSFEILNKYIMQKLDEVPAFLQQVYFDENLKELNDDAFEYLLTAEDGSQSPRRLYLKVNQLKQAQAV
ncbi:MAG: restriction endonuclease subunit S [Bacteroidetes bacterium]|nr:restriction endonuclease subunit S [Bacteroidota bacterium]